MNTYTLLDGKVGLFLVKEIRESLTPIRSKSPVDGKVVSIDCTVYTAILVHDPRSNPPEDYAEAYDPQSVLTQYICSGARTGTNGEIIPVDKAPDGPGGFPMKGWVSWIDFQRLCEVAGYSDETGECANPVECEVGLSQKGKNYIKTFGRDLSGARKAKAVKLGGMLKATPAPTATTGKLGKALGKAVK